MGKVGTWQERGRGDYARISDARISGVGQEAYLDSFTLITISRRNVESLGIFLGVCSGSLASFGRDGRLQRLAQSSTRVAYKLGNRIDAFRRW